MLIKNVSILDEELNIRENCFVAIKDGRISHIGSEQPAEAEGRIIDGSGKLLMSGFFNAHGHSPMTLMRGYGENLSLQDWLNTRIFPFEDHLNGNAVYWATMLAMAESLRFGIVSTSDMYYFCEDMARAVADSGAKANISRSVANPFGQDPSKLASIGEAKSLYENYHKAENGRIRIDMSLHAEYTSDRKTAEALADLARSIGDTVMHVHVSETELEHRECISRHGMTPAAYLADTGLFDVPALAAHCVYATDDDLEIFRRKGVTVALNPVSNMKLASGICDAWNVMEHGVNIALGTDSVCSNNSLDFFEEIKLLLMGSKIARRDPVALSPADALRAATAGGAAAQRRGDTGAVKVGNCADLILLDMSCPHMNPVHDVLNNIAYSCTGSEILMTMVDGRILYEKGEYTTIDIERVIYEVEKAKDKILEKL